MINPYQSIIEFEGDDWAEFLETLMLIDIFMPIIKKYNQPDDVKCVVKYILYAYSISSDHVIMGMDWLDNKKKIFDFVMLKPEKKYEDELVHLKSTEVVETINAWIDFQDNQTFKMLQTLKDLRVQMQIASVSDIKKASGEIDFDQKFKNAKYALELKQMIKDLESELIQNDAKLKDAVLEVKQKRKKKNTIHVGQFAK